MRKLIAAFLAFFILTGSIVLPLGDFSLMKDLPEMYRSYCKIKSGKPDIIDFVGDYLLGGRELLGHNHNDAPIKADGSLQFKHPASNSLYSTRQVDCICLITVLHITDFPIFNYPFHTSEYHNEQFRPPLA